MGILNERRIFESTWWLRSVVHPIIDYERTAGKSNARMYIRLKRKYDRKFNVGTIIVYQVENFLVRLTAIHHWQAYRILKIADTRFPSISIS